MEGDYGLNGICEDPEHEVCFTLEEWNKYYKPKLDLLNNILKLIKGG